MKKIINHLKENWIRHGFETLVVVGGVLIAFSLSNWNQDRQNLREEQRLFSLIHGEMDYYLWLQEKGTEKQENIIASVERLLLAMKDPLDSSNLDNINEDLHTVYSTRWFTGAGTSTNVYDVLVNGGQLGLLSSKQLQKSLASLKENFAYSQIYNEIQANFIDNQLSPFLNQHIDKLSVSYRKLTIDSTLYDSPFSSSYEQLLSSREFSNLLTELVKHTEYILAAYDRIGNQIQQIDSLTMYGNPSLKTENLTNN